MKKGVGSGVGSGSRAESGSISQRYGSWDPDPYHNVTNPQHWYTLLKKVSDFPANLFLQCTLPVDIIYCIENKSSRHR
jgi:hypothetical protein